MRIEALIRPGPYAFGAHVTLADLCLVPQVFNARRFKVDMAQVSEDRRGRRRLPEAPRLRQGAAGKPAGRRIGRGQEEQEGIARDASLPSSRTLWANPSSRRRRTSNVPAAVVWMVGTLLSFSLMAISVRQLGGMLNLFELLMVRAVGGLVHPARS